MKALGFDVPKPELLQILREHGTPSAGQQAGAQPSRSYISQDAFTSLMTQKIIERDPLEEILRAFDLFAGVGGGGGQGQQEPRIGIDDLRRVARELGENLEEEELRAMIDEFDIDNDGMSTFHKFTSLPFCVSTLQLDEKKENKGSFMG